MIALLALSLTCWLCALLAIPGTPPRDNEVAELVYRRLVGRHQLLVALAVLVTLGACIRAVVSVAGVAATP